MARQLFGTDGIRAVAGEFPLDGPTIYAAGAALGIWCKRNSDDCEVLIGTDTRESGPWIAATLAAGLAREGVRTHFAGLITTPGVAFLTRTGHFVAGVMISASHNPYQDNGIKIFGHSGYKLPDEEEHVLEASILRLRDEGVRPATVTLREEAQLDERYLDYLAGTFPDSLAGLGLVVDCGNGAATNLAPALLERLGAKVGAIGVSPDGQNINLNCGALHLEALQERVVETGADAGFAFDGDADRCIAVSAGGNVVNGDGILLLSARHLQAQGRFGDGGAPPLVVSTVMANLGLEKALEAHGIGMVRTPVGDKYVLEEMLRTGAILGGEQSGHVIFSEFATTGDGLLTALQVLAAMVASKTGLDALVSGLEVFPQKLVNVRVKTRRPLEDLALVQEEIAAANEALGADGRVVVRFSGTEPLARVMVEAASQDHVETWTDRIAGAIRAELG